MICEEYAWVRGKEKLLGIREAYSGGSRGEGHLRTERLNRYVAHYFPLGVLGSILRFEANQARLKMGVLAYNLLHMIRQFYVWGEEVKRSIDWLIKRLIKVGARISYHVRWRYVHVASVFPLAHHYRAVLAWVS